MLLLALILLLAASTLAASALAHDEKRWRYAAFVSLACSVALVIRGVRALQIASYGISFPLPLPVTCLIVAGPFVFLFASVITRRRNTPRHRRSLDDDPVLRRYLNEKHLRVQKRRREEEDAGENADLPWV